MTTPRPHAAPEGDRPPGPRRWRGGIGEPPRPLAWAVLAVVVLAVLVGKVAWGQEPTTPETAAAGWWLPLAAGLGSMVAGAGATAGKWLPLLLDRDDRRKPPEIVPPDAQPMPRAEVRAMVTEAVQRVERDGEGQHRRIREELGRLERDIIALGARLTNEQHAAADRREILARELGQILAGIEALRHAVEER